MEHIAIAHGGLKMGGTERALVELLQGLSRDKYKVTLFVENDFGSENIFLKDIPQGVEIFFLKSQKLVQKMNTVRSKKKNILYKLFYNYLLIYKRILVAKKLNGYLKKHPEINLIIDFNAGLIKTIQKYKKVKKIVWIHVSIAHIKKGVKELDKFGKELDKYDKVVTICDDMQEETKKLYPHLEKKLVRIYNSFDFDKIRERARNMKNLTKEEMNLLKTDYILAVSRLDSDQKDFKTLIKAYSLAKKAGFPYNLYIIGEGNARTEIEEQIKTERQEENIILLGLKKNPYIWMQNTNFFVHSSKYEGFGLVLVEAMICGKPVISSNCPIGPREILVDGRVGKLFEVGDVDTFAASLLEMQNECNSYKDLVETRAKDFERNKIIIEVENLIDNLLS